ncbi:MAG: hypothetical protein HRU20_06510 [Pseudomonadales bacterium]|nr:hypothetical protein [Pseudomonadales bacterium]
MLFKKNLLTASIITASFSLAACNGGTEASTEENQTDLQTTNEIINDTGDNSSSENSTNTDSNTDIDSSSNTDSGSSTDPNTDSGSNTNTDSNTDSGSNTDSNVDDTYNHVLIDKQSLWFYQDNGSALTGLWKTKDYDDSGWQQGLAQLGYGEGDENTQIEYGGDESNKNITTYFRHSFNVNDPALYAGLQLDLLSDDGAVVYINGKEVLRDNMPNSAITHNTLAASTISGAAENNYLRHPLNHNDLIAGENIITVELHQRSGSSSDTSFDLSLFADEDAINDNNISDSGSDDSDLVSGLSGLASCESAAAIEYSSAGLPLLESKPGAPFTLFLDYDGGIYHSSSSGDSTLLGYNRNGSYSTFDAEEQRDIIASWQHVSHYYAMFDVNVTTIDAVRASSEAWGWILISEEKSGGRASTSSSAMGRQPYARAYAGSSTVRIENQDKSRRLAHELGHNFTLHHSGAWDEGEFYKWEDWSGWDFKYGAIMGGGGEGDRNGWSFDLQEYDDKNKQDTMAIIRERITNLTSSNSGWSVDDHNDNVRSKLCDDNDGSASIEAVLNKPDDLDQFEFQWGGGEISLSAEAVDVSAALVDIKIIRDNNIITNNTGRHYLDAGTYTIQVVSRGGYGEIGSYKISLNP